jgi:uncharacterized protein
MSSTPFHLAFPVKDAQSTRTFYGEIVQCKEGRSSERSIVYDFFGNQIVAHVVDVDREKLTNRVDQDNVPIPHFGAILALKDFHALAERFKIHDVQFVFEPHLRYKGKSGEQWTMFIRDFSGNALEFKAFEDPKGAFSA